MKRTTLLPVLAGSLLLAVAVPVLAQGGGPKPKLATPVITCSSGSTGASIEILITAGSTGAPAGFSLQWMTLEEYVANGNAWYASSDPRLCKGSYSGSPSQSFNRFSLPANGSTLIKVGDNIDEEVGFSSNCTDDLLCGTDYVFRAFAHANSTAQRSEFTSNLVCSTLACGTGDCTFSQGYWRTHGPAGCQQGNNQNEWPVTTLFLGDLSYDDGELCAILNTPAAGNGLTKLAHQLIAAKLNVANGADATAVALAIADADLLIGSLVVGVDTLPSSAVSVLNDLLTAYNEGAIGPGHCD